MGAAAAFHDWAVTVYGSDYKTDLPQNQRSQLEEAFMCGYICAHADTLIASRDPSGRALQAIGDEMKRFSDRMRLFTKIHEKQQPNN